MTFSEWTQLGEMTLVAAIVVMDLIGLLDQRRTNRLQRAYWQERKDWLARRLLRPIKQKAPEVAKTPEAPS